MPATRPDDKPFVVEEGAVEQEVFAGHEVKDLAHVQEKTTKYASPAVKVSGTHYLGGRCVEILIVQMVMAEMKIQALVVDASSAERVDDKN